MARRAVRLSKTQVDKLPSNLSSALQNLGLAEHLAEPKRAKKSKAVKSTETDKTDTAAAKATPKKAEDGDKPAKKRQGINTAPIFRSLDTALPVAVWDNDTLALDIPGGRILTYNELYSILQYRKYEAFRYKKICRSVIERALKSPVGEAKPYFDGPTRLSILRVGSKEMDLDALPIVFKYFLDSFKKEGIIADDNPNIIVDIQFFQAVGEHRLGMKLERLHDWHKLTPPDWSAWSALKKNDG